MFKSSTMQALVLLFWTLTIGFTVEGEIINDPSICGRTKCQVPLERKFKYVDGTVYKYKYEVNVSTNLGDYNKNNESTLHLDTTVFLTFTSPCEGKIRLRETSLSHDRSKYDADSSDPAGSEFKNNVEKYDLRFAFDDGQVREVCSHPKEDTWALNLKRGVLSMFQNTMKRFDLDRRTDELDINGICETNYRLHEALKTSLVVKKWKNLASCSHSGKQLTMIQSTTYRSPLSQDRTLRKPLLGSYSDCDITIDHNVYQKVECTDSHRLHPLSTGSTSGARSDFKSKLELLSEDSESDAFDDDSSEESEEDDDTDKEVNDEAQNNMFHMKRSNLLFDHRRTVKTIVGELNSSKELLKSICRLAGKAGEIKQRFAEKFTQLVHALRWLDYQSLHELNESANEICPTGKKHIIEALPYIGSNAALTLMKNFILEKKVNEGTINGWVISIAMTPRPDRHAVEAVAPLLDYQNEIPSAQFILSYSALIHSFCMNSPGYNCLNLEPVAQFFTYLETKINDGCSRKYHEFEQMKETLEALKAIGNMGLETESILEKLRTCIDDNSGFVSVETKIAAVEAHRRLPSCEQTRDYFLNHYRNNSLDSEIRIASYLQVMKCPNYSVIRTIKHTLKNEEVNQVGSFVWSHLTNLLASASPTRIEIQSLLTDRDLEDKFNSDMRKFSRNYENSFFSEEYNFGGSHQTNLIFSTKSYIPRTAMINVTLDLFGESINAYEVTMRTEGLEYYAENLFGPNGPFGSDKVGGHFKKFLRYFRSADNKDDGHWNDVKSLPNVIDNNFENPRITLGYKIFGNELKFTILNGDEEIRTTIKDVNPWTKIKQILSGQEIHYENTGIIMDSTYVVPTSVGLPVRLDLTASAACNFKISGLLQSDKIFTHGELEFVGSIMPSVSVDVTGSMTVDAFYKKVGVKLRTNIYTSGAIEAHLKIKGAQLAHLSISLPNDRMEVLLLRSDILFIEENGTRVTERAVGYSKNIDSSNIDELEITPNAKSSPSMIGNTTCSWPALDRLIGLKLCSDYYFANITKNPNPVSFVLSGPTLFKLSVIKADPSAKSYLLEYKWERTANRSMIKFAFDTPGSDFQRELSATLTFDVTNNNVTLVLQSSGNSLIAKGTYKRTDDEIFIDVGLDIKGTKHLDASIGYARKKGAHGYTYTPKLFIAINSERVAELSGTVRNQYKNNVSQCDIQLTFETKRVWSRVMGYIMRRSTSIESNLKVEYQLQKMPKKETLQLEVSLTNKSNKSMTSRSAKIELYSTAYPNLNAIVSAWYEQALGHLELRVEVNSSPHLKDERHKLTAKFIVAYSKAYFHNPGAKISADFSITKPAQNLDIKIAVHHTSVGIDSSTILLVRYAPQKEIILTIKANVARGSLFGIQGHANLTIPNFNSMILQARINERSRHEYDLEFSGTWFSGHNITVRGNYLDKSNAIATSHTLKLVLKSPSFANDILLYCKFHQDVGRLVIIFNAEQQNLDKYAFMLNHTVVSPTNFVSHSEIRYKSSLYALETTVDMDREVRVEIHMDKWRDVMIRALKIYEDDKKEFGVEIKWDANRNPSLKFATSLVLNRHNNDVEKNMTALLTIAYPGRLIIASNIWALRLPNNYIMDVSLQWSRDSVIQLLIDADYGLNVWTKTLKFESQLTTPFENWKKTSLNGRFHQQNNTLSVSSSAHWLDAQTISIEFHGDTNDNNDDGISEWNATSKFVSTIHSIGWITASLSHKQVYASHVDTRLLVKYHPDKVVDVKSIWRLDRNETNDTFNVTGSLNLISPMANYKKGELRCQLQSLTDWKFLGAVNIDLDKRKYTGHLTGDIAHIKESMIQFNITTPIEKYAFIRGRFGLSETNKFIVAELLTPSGPLGFEIIFQLFTVSYDYNIKFLLATPIDVFQRILLIAKLNKKEADYRVAYNKMMAGFKGVWYYESLTQFHYTYIFYTPLEGFEEIGVITKLLVTTVEPNESLDVDTEFSLRVMELKAGFKAHGGPKPPPLRIKNEPVTEATILDAQDYEDTAESVNEEDSFFWKGDVEVNAVIIEPIVGTLDIEKVAYNYNILGSLKIPQGKIVFCDTFNMIDLMNLKNELSIDTPFTWATEIVATNEFTVDFETSNYLMIMSINVRDNVKWHESGLIGNYTYYEEEDGDQQSHVIDLKVRTPLSMLKQIDTLTELDFDENSSKIKFLAIAEECYVNAQSFIETEENFWDVTVLSEINTPVYKLPKSKILVKIDLTGIQKLANFGLIVNSWGIDLNNELEAKWQYENNSMVGDMVLTTCFDALKKIDSHLEYKLPSHPADEANLHLSFNSTDKQFIINGKMTNDKKVSADIYTPLNIARHLTFAGVVVQNANNFFLNGVLKNLEASKNYDVKSTFTITPNTETSPVPMVIDIIITPKSEYPNSGMVSAKIKVNNYLDWDVRTIAELSPNLGTSSFKIHKIEYKFNTKLNVQKNGNTSFNFDLRTPRLDIKTLTLDTNFLIRKNQSDIRLKAILNSDEKYAHVAWRIAILTDMYGKFLLGSKKLEEKPANKELDVEMFFANPGNKFSNVNAGFDIIVDKNVWRFATNATVVVHRLEESDVYFSVILPPPDMDKHDFILKYKSVKGFEDASYLVSYDTEKSKRHYSSIGSVLMSKREIDGHMRLEWGRLQDQLLNNILNITLNSEENSLKYYLRSPKYLNEDTVTIVLNYDSTDSANKLLTADIRSPASSRIGYSKVVYSDITNMNGTLNITTSMKNLTFIGCDFMLLTNLKQNERKLKIFWPTNTALIHSNYAYFSEKLDSGLDGTCLIEVPLNTRHVGFLTYGYKKKPLHTNGYSILNYNDKQMYNAKYTSKGESRAGLEKERMEVTIENVFQPIGIIYINNFEYSAGNAGTNYPTVEFKHANVYRLDNITAFNIIGESKIRTTHEGQDILLKAKHAERTVELTTDYKILPGEFDHNVLLSLAEGAWISYNLNIVNRTTEVDENQIMNVTLMYPKRNFTLEGSYSITESEINSDATLSWISEHERRRTVGSAFAWTNVAEDGDNYLKYQQAVLTFMHPSFEKNVTVKGKMMKRNSSDLFNGELMVDYAHNLNKLLVISAELQDKSELPQKRSYQYAINGKHPRTKLQLNVEGLLNYKRAVSYIETKNYGHYKRGFYAQDSGEFSAYADIPNYEIEFNRKSDEIFKYLKMRVFPYEPDFKINGSIINKPTLNATGLLTSNWDEKVIRMMLNYTPDAVESLRMYGNIPDARNAVFDIWRTYDEDLTISDVAFYLKLNHSRLITSSLRWRPELKSDITNLLKSSIHNTYDEMCNDLDYWKHYIRTETVAVMSDIWEDAREDVSEFLEDWHNLQVIEEDFEDLKLFLNKSYNANDFYVKDIVAIGIYVIDQLSLRSHIESLPNILNEIWEIMGESGEAIRKSLIWVIEAIKDAYRKLSEIVSAVLKGDSLTQIAGVIEKLVEKYDRFIKDLHVSFIKYVENLWRTMAQSLSQQWNKFLRMIEPMFIQFIHYLETIAWKASKEILDFMYERRNEIITSPYFDKFTKLTQDIDRVYRDIKANDLFTNITKYTSLILQFLRDRYFAAIPFGKELKDVIEEIVTEIKELEKLPSVHFAVEKTKQVIERIYYLYEYFEVKNKIEYTLRILHSKLMDVSQSALQAESRYREAKTMFIFDPNNGLMCLEQKLPMSWHAFNRTPEFQEIPEYRAIVDMGSYFITSNTTFWALYYHYKPYAEPSNWLPPFRARASIVGSQHYVTFDGQQFEFAGPCTYLLAHDFVKDQFAILVKYDIETNGTDTQVTHKIIVLDKHVSVEIDVFNNIVKLTNSASSLQLPAEFQNGTVQIFQDESVIVIERDNDQLRLECNLKFNTCTLELSGWYFGKTAGLFGTMNNEPADDFLASNNIVTKDLEKFTHSWAVNKYQCTDEQNYAHASPDQSYDNSDLPICAQLFANISSEFSPCFAIVEASGYGEACINSKTEEEACSVALAYMQACKFQHTHLRIPDKCTSCQVLEQSDEVSEGEFRQLEGDLIPRSSDVVFIVEAKECNRDIRTNKSIDLIISQMDKELQEKGLVENQYSLVIFGGDGVYNKPKNLVLDNQVFTKNTTRFADYFKNIPIGDGNQDIFAAVGFASKLVFRAGVSKTLILLPCSRCDHQNQSLDYSVLHQVLLEQGITLHILIHDDFQFDKERLNKIFFGMDAFKAYTKKDSRVLVGQSDLRRQVKLPKNMLGFCSPLALETNGTLFTSNKLRYEKTSGIKKFVNVFTKRVALTAQPYPCQHCECIANNDGISKMECLPCIYPGPVTDNFFNDLMDDMDNFSGRNIDYSQFEVEEDR